MGYVNNPTLLAAGDIVLGLALIPELTFLAIYMTTAKWWKTAIGRMFVIAQVAIVFGQTYPGRDWIRLLGYSAHFAGQIVFLVTYLVERRTPASRHRIPKTRMDTRS
jgi:hypothetical protein